MAEGDGESTREQNRQGAEIVQVALGLLQQGQPKAWLIPEEHLLPPSTHLLYPIGPLFSLFPLLLLKIKWLLFVRFKAEFTSLTMLEDHDKGTA